MSFHASEVGREPRCYEREPHRSRRLAGEPWARGGNMADGGRAPITQRTSKMVRSAPSRNGRRRATGSPNLPSRISSWVRPFGRSESSVPRPSARVRPGIGVFPAARSSARSRKLWAGAHGRSATVGAHHDGSRQPLEPSPQDPRSERFVAMRWPPAKGSHGRHACTRWRSNSRSLQWAARAPFRSSRTPGIGPPVSDQVPQRVWLRSTPMPVTEREWTPCAGSVCQRSPAWGRPRVTRSD